MTRIIIREFSPLTETIASIPDSGTELPATYVHHATSSNTKTTT